MKKLLLIGAMVATSHAQDGNFQANVYSLDGNDFVYVTGNYQSQAKQPSCDNQDLSKWATYYSQQLDKQIQTDEIQMQTYELQKQTKLLKQIAEKQ